MNLTERMASYRERILSTKPSICLERARFYTKAYKEHADKSIPVKRAIALKETLEGMSLVIEPEDLIVGNHSSRIYAAPIFPEYAVEWIEKEINDFEKRPGDAYFPDEQTKSELLSLCKFWEKSTTLDKGRAMMADHLREIHDAQIIRAEGNLTSGDAHIAIHFSKLLERGIQSYVDEAKRRQAQLKDFTKEDAVKKNEYYKATIIVLEGFHSYILRYRDTAALQAEKEQNALRREELETIAETCDRIAADPPQSFLQALQLVFFSQIVLQIESNGHSLSLGRLDQYLYPFYARDLRSGAVTPEEAMELFTNVWLKLTTVKKIRSWSHTKFSAGGPLYQNVTIGGINSEGRDAVNDLSYLILHSVGAAKVTQPNLSVRFHPEISEDFLLNCIEVIRLGFGMPAFNNDSIVIPSLRSLGVEEEDAWDYSAIGCIEVAVPGRWGYRVTGKHFLNFMRVFLASIHDGYDTGSGKQFYPGRGRLEDFTDFSEVMEAWKEQVAFYAEAGVAIDTAIDIVLRDEAPDMLCSTFTDDCLKRGMTIHEGGSKYDFVSGLQVGIANLADSLAAIKKLVFEDERISAAELMEALEHDFAGVKGEKLRQILLNHAPKYGNDEDYVDELIQEAYGYYIDAIEGCKTIRASSGAIGCSYFAGTSSISGNVPAGAIVPATPDGRKAWKPLAEGASPSGGADIKGPTAVMKSISKLPTDKITGGVLLNQKINPSILQHEEKKRLLMSMWHTFFDDLKGWHIQYNVVNRETLLDAKEHPEKHRDLIVRIAGYSAFFTVLSPNTQDDIISRTEQVF